MKKKGFTLVELLGVITILGIIALIIIPVVENSNKRIKKKAYEKQKDAIILALKDYRTSTPELFYTTDVVNITLGELKELGFIDYDLRNPKTEMCISNDLQLKIEKFHNNYEYSIIGDELIDGNEYDCDVEYVTSE